MYKPTICWTSTLYFAIIARIAREISRNTQTNHHLPHSSNIRPPRTKKRKERKRKEKKRKEKKRKEKKRTRTLHIHTWQDGRDSKTTPNTMRPTRNSKNPWARRKKNDDKEEESVSHASTFGSPSQLNTSTATKKKDWWQHLMVEGKSIAVAPPPL